MTLTQEIQEEFYKLMGDLREGVISVEQKTRLDLLLGQYPVLRQVYVDYILLWHELRCYQPMSKAEHSCVTRRMDIAAIEREAQRRLDRFLAEQEEIRRLQQSASGQCPRLDLPEMVGRVRQQLVRVCQLAAKAAVTIAFALAVLTAIQYTRTGPIVASLADSMDAVWDVNIEKYASLHKGQFKLDQGYARIRFLTGADVSIEAPAEFRLESANRMVLLSGRMFAEVPSSARGFIVDTPHARIVDMGTQFGVATDPARASDLHMFKGKASLSPVKSGRAGQAQTLVEGQAKSVDIVAAVTDIHPQQDAFVRHFCSQTGLIWRGERLSLADLVGRGNGLGNGQTNVFLDPVDGYTGSPICEETGNAFHPLPSNSFVDGLFVPDGRTKQVVSSQGHVFADCPVTNGASYASLGVNPNQRVWATDKRNGVIRFDGQDYGSPDHSCLMMHANLGITFDLNAVRALCPNLRISRFATRTAVVDFSEAAGCNADFWVTVDGQVRYARLHVTQKAVLADVSVDLGPADRFLTLMTTDGGDVDRPGAYQRAYTCDWCVFVEPALVVAPE